MNTVTPLSVPAVRSDLWQFTGALIDIQFVNGASGRGYADLDAIVNDYLQGSLTCDPSGYFRGELYHRLHPDIARKGGVSLAHYLNYGRAEQRNPHPLFETAYVLFQLKSMDVVVDPQDVYLEFLAGKFDIATHRLIDIDHVRAKHDRDLTALEIFAALCDPDSKLPFSPHPLFDKDYYARNNTLTYANELIDYLLNHTAPARPSPLFNDYEYEVRLPTSLQESTALLDYVVNWHRWPSDPTQFIDLKFLNHQLAVQGVSGVGDPLSRYVDNVDRHPLLATHPHLDARMLAFAFANLIPGKANVNVIDIMAMDRGWWSSAPANAAEMPLISVIILNYYKPVLTLFSVYAALNALRNFRLEILVVDNGSEMIDHELLRRSFSDIPQVRMIRMRENRYFGEANNIGVDLSTGDYIFYLNNDCFLHHTFGVELKAHMDARPGTHVVGSVMLFPDGQVQEFGGLVSDAGEVIQRGKHLDVDYLDRRTAVEEVDYVSAACCVMPRVLLDHVVGFDPAFEPFYYEDTDLMRRVREAGFKVLVNPRLRAVHIENASTREYLQNSFMDMITAHRQLFARRWMKHQGQGALIDRTVGRFAVTRGVLPRVADRQRPVAVVYTPFDLTAGGGERYTLATAVSLSKSYDVAICSDKEISTARVKFTLNALGLPMFSFRVITASELAISDKPDLFFAMGNEIVPSSPALGRASIFHLQFPFPWRNVAKANFGLLTGYQAVVVNSQFTKGWTARRFREAGVANPPPIEVLYPPIRKSGAKKKKTTSKPDQVLQIVGVGRFFVGGHSKRQDIFLDILEELTRHHGIAFQATLIGSVHNNEASDDYFNKIMFRCRDLGNVRVLRDATTQELAETLENGDIYLHCAGTGVRETVFPERLEHFGISIIEAVNAGCFPVVYAAGGPAEIIRTGNYGHGYNTVSEAATVIATYAKTPGALAKARKEANMTWFNQLGDEYFQKQMLQLAAGLQAAVE